MIVERLLNECEMIVERLIMDCLRYLIDCCKILESLTQLLNDCRMIIRQLFNSCELIFERMLKDFVYDF